MARHIVMDYTGHKQIDFDADDVVELEEARRRFDELTAKGYRGAVSHGDGTHTLVRVFDPTAEQMIFVPALRGG